MRNFAFAMAAVVLLSVVMVGQSKAMGAGSDDGIQLRRVAQDDRADRREDKAEQKREKREEKRERKRHKHHRKHHKGQI